MEPAIRVHDVHFDYGTPRRFSGRCLLDGLSFDVRQGEVVGIIGPNGCGKSTLINLISKVLAPHAGEVYFQGCALSAMKHRDVARLVAVLPQSITMSFHYTVEEMVLMGRAPYRSRLGWESDADYRMAEEAMALTRTDGLAGRWFLELSGGEKSRVLLARTLAQCPQLFLLDEPTANLDLQFQTQLLDMLVGVARTRRATLVIVTHDLNLVGEYCDRVLALKNGRIYREGSPAEVITPETIAEVYGAEVYVGCNPHSGAPHVFLKAEKVGKRLKAEG